jgi:Transposase, Mutator family
VVLDRGRRGANWTLGFLAAHQNPRTGRRNTWLLTTLWESGVATSGKAAGGGRPAGRSPRGERLGRRRVGAWRVTVALSACAGALAPVRACRRATWTERLRLRPKPTGHSLRQSLFAPWLRPCVRLWIHVSAPWWRGSCGKPRPRNRPSATSMSWSPTRLSASRWKRPMASARRSGSTGATATASATGTPRGVDRARGPEAARGLLLPGLAALPRRRAEEAFVAVIADAYLAGVSTRRVEKLVGQLGVERTVAQPGLAPRTLAR